MKICKSKLRTVLNHKPETFREINALEMCTNLSNKPSVLLQTAGWGGGYKDCSDYSQLKEAALGGSDRKILELLRNTYGVSAAGRGPELDPLYMSMRSLITEMQRQGNRGLCKAEKTRRQARGFPPNNSLALGC